MKYAAAFALLAVFSVVPCFGQANPSDSQTLKDILTEIRGLHNDVRLSQTTQILLTELEVQQTAVTRAMQKRDDLKTRVSQLQTNQKNFASQIAQIQERADATIDPVQKKQFAQMQEQLTGNLANFKSQEADASNDLAGAESALRKEQDTLENIQGRLDEVVSKLQPVSQ